MFKPKTKTLPQMLRSAVLLAVTMTAAFGLSFYMVSNQPATIVFPEKGANSAPVETIATGPTAGDLMERFDCWNGEPPADMVGVVPGHVLITEDGKTYRAGSVKVGEALNSLFEGKPTEIQTIHGFCR